jgi:hypothetical protein
MTEILDPRLKSLQSHLVHPSQVNCLVSFYSIIVVSSRSCTRPWILLWIHRDHHVLAYFFFIFKKRQIWTIYIALLYIIQINLYFNTIVLHTCKQNNIFCFLFYINNSELHFLCKTWCDIFFLRILVRYKTSTEFFVVWIKNNHAYDVPQK